MKKALIIILMVCLTFGMAFAAKKADVKLGVQAGFGSTTYSNSVTVLSTTTYYKGSQGGLYVAATGEYGIGKNLGLQASFGINTFSDAKVQAKVGDGEWKTLASTTDSNNLPLQFVLSVAPKYNYELSKEMTLSGAVGLEMMFGKESKASNAETSVEVGFGLEGSVAYKLADNLNVVGGIKWAMLFGNINDTSYSFSSFRAFAGATYAL